MVNVRDFKAKVSQFMRQKEPVMVLRNGKPAGVFVPWEDIQLDAEVRKAVLMALTTKLAQERAEKGISEEEVLKDFAAFRKDCS